MLSRRAQASAKERWERKKKARSSSHGSVRVPAVELERRAQWYRRRVAVSSGLRMCATGAASTSVKIAGEFVQPKFSTGVLKYSICTAPEASSVSMPKVK